jgi:hypothetical protein
MPTDQFPQMSNRFSLSEADFYFMTAAFNRKSQRFALARDDCCEISNKDSAVAMHGHALVLMVKPITSIHDSHIALYWGP